MTKERWQDIKAKVKESFGIEDEYQEDLEPGVAEVLEFNGPQGRMLLRFVTKPRLLDQKTSFSNRAAAGVDVENVYSETETVSYFDVYNWSEAKDDWIKLDSEALF